MKSSGPLAIGVLAVSAALLTPSALSCDEDAVAGAKSPKAPAAAEKPAAGTATDATRPAPAKPSAAPERGQALPRMVVTREKETGRIRLATPEEVRALTVAPTAGLLSTPGSPLVTTLPDGTKSLDLTERYFSMAVARKGPDGTVRERCVGTEKEKLEFLSTAPPPPPAKPAGAGDEK